MLALLLSGLVIGFCAQFRCPLAHGVGLAPLPADLAHAMAGRVRALPDDVLPAHGARLTVPDSQRDPQPVGLLLDGSRCAAQHVSYEVGPVRAVALEVPHLVAGPAAPALTCCCKIPLTPFFNCHATPITLNTLPI